jgi:hypothetical protein
MGMAALTEENQSIADNQDPYTDQRARRPLVVQDYLLAQAARCTPGVSGRA